MKIYQNYWIKLITKLKTMDISILKQTKLNKLRDLSEKIVKKVFSVLIVWIV